MGNRINKTSLVFTGDIGFDKYMDHMWEDENLVSDDAMAFLRSGDHLIVNVEGALSLKDKEKRDGGAGKLTHSMDPAVADFLNKIGADIWNINNNHIMDAGPDGMKDTLSVAEKCGVKTIGAGMNIDEAKRPIIFSDAGGIGILSVGYERACRKATVDEPGCLNFSDMEIIKEQIVAIKERCRWCVVVAHDGEEFTALPSPYTRDRYISYLDMGADVVVAHHPHVPMNYETFTGDDGKTCKAIFYSLGNFIFDTDYQRSQYNTEYGLFLKLVFSNNEFSFEPYGIRIDRDTEHIVSCKIPDIFVDVNADEYEKLKPLAARMFIENTKRQLKYLKPDIYTDATEQQFIDNFYEPLRSGRVPGKLLDFQIVYPLSKEADKGEWKKSELEGVKKFILEQI